MWKTADHFHKIGPNEQVLPRPSDLISLLGDSLKATKRVTTASLQGPQEVSSRRGTDVSSRATRPDRVLHRKPSASLPFSAVSHPVPSTWI